MDETPREIYDQMQKDMDALVEKFVSMGGSVLYCLLIPDDMAHTEHHCANYDGGKIAALGMAAKAFECIKSDMIKGAELRNPSDEEDGGE